MMLFSNVNNCFQINYVFVIFDIAIVYKLQVSKCPESIIKIKKLKCYYLKKTNVNNYDFLWICSVQINFKLC